ncbi:MAG: pilus assembly protein TadG-related protein [Hyphomicrobiaceae bacterium]|nr:pilus assembly protein TadG-related protein [Hyphomicrobiaceae bacterium]
MTKSLASKKPFSSAADGNVGILFAMLAVPVTLLAGGTVDYGRALSQKARVQAAADAAALAAARPIEATEAKRKEIAASVFKANYSGLTPTVTIGGNIITVEAGTSVATPFLNLASIPTLAAQGYAKAVAGETISATEPGKICLLALDPSSADGIHLQGDNQVNYDGCWAHTNSKLGTAINASGSNAKASGKGHCAVGGYTQTHNTFYPLPTVGCREVADPYATVGAYVIGATYQPAFTPPVKADTCKASNLNLKKGFFQLDPGRYCGGINIQAGATVTFKPGVYFIDNGVLNVQSGSSVSGSSLLFYLAGASSRMQVIGGGKVDLSGRKTGETFAGFLVIADAAANPGGVSNIQGGGAFKMEGVVYMPTQRIEVSGNGDVNNGDVAVYGMVAKDFYFRGNGVFNARKHTGSGSLPDIMPVLPVEGIREATLQ